LHLCGNRLGDAATSALCTSLLCDPQSQCTTLSLSNNRLTSTGASALSRALSDNTTLTALHLDGNIGFGDSGATALAESLIRNGALATLSLAACRIGDLGAAALGSALSANFGLFSLVLRQNNVRDLGADAVWRGLEGNRCLRHLDMACNGYGPVGVKLLSTVLARNAFVTSLRVDGCKIGTDGEGWFFKIAWI
jgi:Ran GTPase-activating protein (RanGAP) involved in mRNA processing and transport